MSTIVMATTMKKKHIGERSSLKELIYKSEK